MAKDHANMGNRLGPRIARLTADAIGDTHRKLGPHKRRLFMQMQEDFFRLTGAEQKATLGPLWAQLADDPDAEEWMRATFGFLAHGSGQWQTLLAHAVAGNALQVGLGGLINNAMAPVVGKIISESPRGLLDPGTLANAAVRGHVDNAEAAYFASRQGLNRNMWDVLTLASRSELPVGAILDLLNRSEISAAEAHTALKYNGFDAEAIPLLLATRRQLLSPAVAADAVIRGILTDAEGAKIAGGSGMHGDDFATLVLDTGEAPALQTLLEAYRRGIIDDARLQHGIRTGRLRNEWFDVAKALRYAPVSPSEAIAGAVEGHLDQGKARHLAEQAGLDPANFEWLFQTHGQPIATGQAIELWRRGKLTEAEVTQVVRESRTKTKYIPAVLELRRHLLPERTIASMFHRGALTHAQATERLRWQGIADDDILALLAEGTATKTAGHRELSEGHVLELYADKAITTATATAHLKALGYTDTDTVWVLDLYQLRAARRRQLAGVAVVRAKYVSRHLDDTGVVTALDALAVAGDERDLLLPLWKAEREATRRLPTVAELTTAQKAGVITAEQWVTRITELGYAVDDVPIMLAAHKITSPGA